MKPKNKHISQEEMLAAIGESSIWFHRHLNKCRKCLKQFERLNHLINFKPSEIATPDKTTVDRFSLIPLLSKIKGKTKSFMGELAFDSWANMSIIQIRDSSPGFIRRLCLKAENITVEIIGQRQQYNWEFTARVYEAENPSYKWILNAGEIKLLPGSLGFYQWSSDRKPQVIKIYNSEKQIYFRKILWV